MAKGRADTSPGEVIWRYETEGIVHSSPTVMDGTVYVGSQNNTLHAVDTATGEQEWEFTESSGSIYSSPTVVNGTVYVGSSDNTLYAVDASSGEELWRFTEPSDQVRSSPTVVDGTVYVGSDDNTLYAVDASSGEEVWQFTEPSDKVYSSPTVVGGTVYFGSNDSTLYAVDAATGEQEWAFIQPLGSVRSSPTVVDGVVYVGSRDETVYAVDAETGAQEWAFTESSGSIYSSPTVVDGTVYFGTYGALCAVGAVTGDWEWAFTEPSDWVFSSPTVADGTVYVGSQDETLYAVGATTGEQEWAFTDMSASVRSSPTVADGTVYVGTDALYALDAGISGSSEDSRVLLRTLGHHDKHPDTESGEETKETARQTDDTEVKRKPTDDERLHPPEEALPVPSLSIDYARIDDKQPVGSGGNADVYKTTYEGETIAIKEPRMSGTLHKEAAERFMQEAETWDKLDDHENIVSVIDYGSKPLPWIALEYMDGGDLSTRADEMSFDEKLWSAIQITKAVRHAHRRGIAHLDLKPENVLFRKTDDSYDLPKVADWGLAKMLLEHSKSIEGMSPQYSAPEQFNEDEYGKPDDLTDVYQLGTVFYEMFAGKPPFEGKPSKVMHSVLYEEPEPPTELNPNLPEELDRILLKALEKDSEDRYETVIYLRDDLREML